jgi:GH15 family glucan-1,4-alpha-glucosidase
MLWLRSDVPTHGENFRTVAEFTVKEGQRVAFDLTWYPSNRPQPGRIDVEQSLVETEQWWSEWSARNQYDGPWEEAVTRSLITLKALTYAPTGGLVASPTTSLPENFGGERNWDYRYCWLRDATFTLMALMDAGYTDEACAWREWLLRAVAGRPDQIQIMYGLAGERRLTEYEIPWLEGFSKSKPVRVGNDAHSQRQLDVYGEVMDAMYQAARFGLAPDGNAWQLERTLLKHLECVWREKDEGVWEVRGPQRHFTHSKIMAWVAFDRAVKAVEQFNVEGPVDRWRAQRDAIHAEVLAKGFNQSRNAFVQYYGSDHLDASLLVAPLVGFLPPTDPRIISTVEAIQRELGDHGFLSRYRTTPEVDGLPPKEGKFLLCSFWLVDALTLIGRDEEAKRIFEKLLSIRNDLGLLAEGYDPEEGRFTGNFPQAFSHVGLVNSAMNLAHYHRPAVQRKEK